MIVTNSDGGARGNPGLGAIGVLIRNDDSIVEMYSEKVGKVTNNVAEYLGLIKALQLAATYTKDEITCYLDSELIVKQLLGNYRVKNETLMKLFLEVQKLQENFKKIKYIHVRRNDAFQKMVDALLNMELDEEN
ncbi:MAG TPA: ribonuclease HI family protein [Candidatus Nanoarchaeia archaeon]|nr:ribonuclease HI family protein [Candidatus Nanoarchaeia archaeon]